MRLIVLLAFLSLCHFSFATNYYVAANGNDNNSGTSPSSPWKTINKVNSFTFKPGDQILFNRGDEFYGGIVVKQSGTAGAPITYGAYGSGTKPVITGFTEVTSWTNKGGNIWESNNPVTSLDNLNMVVIEGKNTPMGRWPNNGWATYESAVGNTSITSSKLAPGINWKGAEAVIRKNYWTIDKSLITSQSGNTLTYKTASNHNGNGVPNNGFFIQNDIKTLDSENEWYFNPTTKKISVFSYGKPLNIKVTSLENLFLSDKNYIGIENLRLSGANGNGIVVGGAITISGNDIDYCGVDGITTIIGSRSTYFKVLGNNITHCNNSSVSISQSGDNPVEIKNNIIKNSGLVVGASQSALHANVAIRTVSKNSGNDISYNRIDSTGYIGILFSNGHVHHNYISNFCSVMQDGGGIYTASNASQLIENNIVSHGYGNYSGMAAVQKVVYGIYMDVASSGGTVRNNTVFNIEGFGYYFNDPDRLKFTGNTSYNISEAAFKVSTRTKSFVKSELTDNVFCVPDLSQSSAYFIAVRYPTDFSTIGTIDNNYLIMSNPDKVFRAELFSPSWSNKYYPFSVWNGSYKNDIHSTLKHINITNVRFEYNASNSQKTISLGAAYKDPRGKIYDGFISLEPYTSAVLFYHGPSQLPQVVANAGPNQTIMLPKNSVSLNGSGSGGSGKISSYYWSKLSGPSGEVIANVNSASTTVSSLKEGTYQFVLRVKDDKGSDGYDTTRVIVQPPQSYALPVINAGPDQTIFLPNSTAYLNGEITGGSASYIKWSKISGPSSFNIVNPSSLSTSVTGLVEGVYSFQLELKDSGGSTYYEKTQVSVIGGLLPAVNPLYTTNGLEYSYYEGSYSNVPAFDKITARVNGKTDNFNLAVSNSSRNFALSFNGYIDVPTDGQYTFYTSSDDGSMLYIDGHLVVNNDGRHGVVEKSGTIGLRAGKHAISLGYFQAGGGMTLDVSYTGPGISKRSIPNSMLYRISSVELLEAVNPGMVTGGLDYAYYEGSYNLVPGFNKIIPEKKGFLDNVSLSVANRQRDFALNFSGYIEVPTDGQYTFYTTSDDGSLLYIDGHLIVDNDGRHGVEEKMGTIGLKAGKHAIEIGYFQAGGGMTLDVNYSGPGISKRSLPSSSLYRSFSGLMPAVNPGNTVNGLDYSYYEGYYSVVPNFGNTTAIKSGTVNNFTITVANRSRDFAMDFSGFIEVSTDGQYTFYTSSDDGSLLYIDGTLVVDNNGKHGLVEKSGTIGLKAGKHAISVGYFQGGGGKALDVSYAGPGISKRLVPSDKLFRISTAQSRTGGSGPGFASTLNMATSDSLNKQELAVRGLTEKVELNVFPNPFVNSFVVSLAGESGDYKLHLMDVLGRTIWIKSGSKGAGVYRVTIDGSSLGNGVYFLKVVQGKNTSVFKLKK